MHFERTLYRIHENVLWRLTMDDPALAGGGGNCGPIKACRTVLTVLWVSIAILAGTLITCHVTHVGSGGCLMEVLQKEIAWYNNATGGNATLDTYFTKEAVFRIRIKDETGYDGLLGGVFRQSSGDNVDPDPDFAPHYIFSGMPEAVTMGQQLRKAHGFPVYNFTIPVWCDATGPGAAVVTAGVVSYDPVAVNSAMYSFPGRSGYLLSAVTGEIWNWPAVRTMESDVKGVHNGDNGIGTSLLIRIGVLLSTFLNFFLMSSMSALFLRILLVSGPAIMWPLISCLGRYCGDRRGVDFRELNAAYPWLGIQMRYHAAAGASPINFLTAHGLYLFICYLMYASAASVWSDSLLGYKSHPAGLWQLLWLVVLASEYFSLMSLRSAWGILVFPRSFLCLFIAWSAYYNAYPYPFASLAGTLFMLCTIALMAFVVLTFEVPALRSGAINLDKPRAYMTVLPGPAAPASAPSEFSSFMLLNNEPLGPYEAAVPRAADVLIRSLPPGATIDPATGAAAAAGEGGAVGAGAAAVVVGGAAALPDSQAAAVEVVVMAPGGPAVGPNEGGRRPLLDQDQLREAGHAEQFN